MSYSGLGSEVSETERTVTLRSILLGVFFCALLGVAIPYYDILVEATELGGSHFAVGPIFFFIAIILLINVPLKSGLKSVQAAFSAVLGALTGGIVWRLMDTDLTATLTVMAIGFAFFFLLQMALSIKGRLNSHELIVIFAMMLIGSGIPTFGLVSQLLPMMTSWQHLAPGRAWQDAFFRHIPDWLVVGNPEHMIDYAAEGYTFEQVTAEYYMSIQWFYDGLPEGITTREFLAVLGDWIKPAIGWGLFITFLYTYMFSITSILRKQWVERERLSFPLMQLPIELAQAEESPGMLSPLFKNPWLLGGVGIPFLIHSLLQLNYHVTGSAVNPLRQVHWHFMRGTAFGAFGNLHMHVYFAVIGFCYLLSKEITLSLWLFFLINRMQRVVHDMIGAPPLLSSPSDAGSAQFFGGLVVFVLFGLYAARRHLMDVFRKAFTHAPDIDDSGELIGYRASVIALLASLIGLIGWCWFMGMQVQVAIAVFAGFTIAIIGITRAVAEGGILFAKPEPAIPGTIMNNLTGTTPISAPSLTVLGFIQYVSLYDVKTLLMPAVMQGCKARDTVNDRSKKTLAAFVLACVVVVLVSGIGTMWGVYNLGASNVHNWFYIMGPSMMAFDPLARWIDQPTGPNFTAISYMVGGGLVTGLLIFLRRSLAWWPLHPLGYIMADGFWESSRVWFSFFLGWLFKVFILAFGGGKWFKKLRPFFLGLILGEFGTAGLWLVVGLLMGDAGPRLFP